MQQFTRVVCAMATTILLIAVIAGIVQYLFFMTPRPGGGILNLHPRYKYYTHVWLTTQIVGRSLSVGMALSFVTAVLYLIRWCRGDKLGNKVRVILWFQVLLILMALMALMAWNGVR